MEALFLVADKTASISTSLAYRWFCRPVPDHSTFSRDRHRRIRKSDILRHLFETVVFNIC
jgi:transposase